MSAQEMVIHKSSNPAKNIKKTAENIGKHLVQFEKDFNSRTKKPRSGGVALSQTRPIPRSPDGDNEI